MNKVWGKRIGVGTIILAPTDKVLLGYNFKKAWWEISGGRQEKEESVADAALREVLEETGLQIPESNLKYIGYIDNYSRYWLSMVFVTHQEQTIDIENFERHTFKYWQWFDLNALPTDTSALTIACIRMLWN